MRGVHFPQRMGAQAQAGPLVHHHSGEQKPMCHQLWGWRGFWPTGAHPREGHSILFVLFCFKLRPQDFHLQSLTRALVGEDTADWRGRRRGWWKALGRRGKAAAVRSAMGDPAPHAKVAIFLRRRPHPEATAQKKAGPLPKGYSLSQPCWPCSADRQPQGRWSSWQVEAVLREPQTSRSCNRALRAKPAGFLILADREVLLGACFLRPKHHLMEESVIHLIDRLHLAGFVCLFFSNIFFLSSFFNGFSIISVKIFLFSLLFLSCLLVASFLSYSAFFPLFLFHSFVYLPFCCCFLTFA